MDGWKVKGWSRDESQTDGHAPDDAGRLGEPAAAGCNHGNPCVAGSRFVSHVIFGPRVHVIHIDFVPWERGHRPNELPVVREDE